MAAFRLGLALGADGIELDVHATADGVPVVIHDGSLDRTTDGVGQVDQLRADVVLRADARPRWIGDSAERATVAADWPATDTHVPALSDVIAWLPADRGLVIDVKAMSTIEPVVELLASSRRDVPGTTRVISFLPQAIAAARRLAPWLETGLLLDESEDLDGGIAAASSAGHSSVVPWAPDLGFGTALQDAVGRVRRAGMELGVYTVNDVTRALQLRDAGVSFLMSDVPAPIAAARGSRQ